MNFEETHSILQLVLGADTSSTVFAISSGKISISCNFALFKVKIIIARNFDAEIYYTDMHNISAHQRVVRNHVYKLISHPDKSYLLGNILLSLSLIYYSQEDFVPTEPVATSQLSLEQASFFREHIPDEKHEEASQAPQTEFSCLDVRRKLAKQLSLSMAGEEAFEYEENCGVLRDLSQFIEDRTLTWFQLSYEHITQVHANDFMRTVRALKTIDEQYYYVQIYDQFTSAHAVEVLSKIEARPIMNTERLLHYWEEAECMYVQFEDVNERYVGLPTLIAQQKLESVSRSDIMTIAQKIFDFCDELARSRLLVEINERNLFVNDEMEILFCNVNYLSETTHKGMRRSFRAVLELLSQHDSQLSGQIICAFDNNNQLQQTDRAIHSSVAKLLSQAIRNQLMQLPSGARQRFRHLSSLERDFECYMTDYRHLRVVRHPELGIAIQACESESNIFYAGQPLFLKRLYLDARPVARGECWRFQTAKYLYYVFEEHSRDITFAKSLADYLGRLYKGEQPTAGREYNLCHICIGQEAIAKVYNNFHKLVVEFPSINEDAARLVLEPYKIKLELINEKKLTTDRIEELFDIIDNFLAGFSDITQYDRTIGDTIQQFKHFVQENIKTTSKTAYLLDRKRCIDVTIEEGCIFLNFFEICKRLNCQNIFELNFQNIITAEDHAVAAFEDECGDEVEHLLVQGFREYFLFYNYNELSYRGILDLKMHASEQITERDLCDMYSIAAGETHVATSCRDKHACLRQEVFRFFIYAHAGYLRKRGYNILMTSYYSDVGIEYVMLEADAPCNKRMRKSYRPSRSAKRSSTDE